MRLVLDTNVWLDWLVFDDPGIATLKAAAAAGHLQIFIDEACAAELAQVLNYPLLRKTVLSTVAQAACMAECRRIARDQAINEAFGEPLPKCRDPDDQKFLELARNCGADYLVTKDRLLLELARRTSRCAPFGIVTPETLTTELLTAQNGAQRTSEL